ncbi:MAG: tetratricopeptide repeat protein [Sumerlaeia bacterium]
MESEEINETLKRLFSAAEAASSEGLVDEAIEKCEQAMEIMDFHFDEILAFTHSDFMMLAGHSCWEDSDARKAHRYYRHAYEMDFGRLDAAVAMAVSLFHLGAFASAQNHLEMVSVDETDVGEVWYYLALCAVRQGKADLAAIFFQRAHEIEPNRWAKPHYHKEVELKKIVEEFIKRLPEEFRDDATSLPVCFQPFPSDAQIHSFDPPLDPLSMVLFEGTTRMEEKAFSIQKGNSQLVVFPQNVGLIASDPEKFRSDFEEALLEEYARYLGLDYESEDDEEAEQEDKEENETTKD